MRNEKKELDTPSGSVVLEWKDGHNWRLFEKLERSGPGVDKLSVGYLKEFGRRLLKGKRYRVRSI